jgi:hypothetical protein
MDAVSPRDRFHVIDEVVQRIRIARMLNDDFTGEASDYWANRFLRETTATLKRLPALVH